MQKAIESTHITKQEKKSIFAVVGVVFNKEGKVLLGMSTLPDELRKDKWCFPGGGHEKGETEYQTAWREVEEETGISTKPINIASIIDTDIPGISFVVLMRTGGQIKMNEEFSDMDWFSIDQLPKPIVKQNKQVLTKVLKYLDKDIDEERSIVRVKKNTISKGFL